MNLKVMYQTPVLKLMNALVFIDTFILIFIGVGLKGSQGMVFGMGYGILGGLAATLMFNVMVFAVIAMKSK
jgi:hypothetical protein